MRVGWATNRCPHDKHVGSVGVALGFSIGSGRIQFCGAPAKQFLKGVRVWKGRCMHWCVLIAVCRAYAPATRWGADTSECQPSKQ